MLDLTPKNGCRNSYLASVFQAKQPQPRVVLSLYGADHNRLQSQLGARAVGVRRPQFSRTASAARRGSSARRSGSGTRRERRSAARRQPQRGSEGVPTATVARRRGAGGTARALATATSGREGRVPSRHPCSPPAVLANRVRGPARQCGAALRRRERRWRQRLVFHATAARRARNCGRRADCSGPVSREPQSARPGTPGGSRTALRC